MDFPIREVSSAAILIPLVLGFLRMRVEKDLRYVLFFVFLLFGAISDGYGWYTFASGNSFYYHSLLLNFYSLFEALFFIWLSTSFMEKKRTFWLRAVFGPVAVILGIMTVYEFFTIPYDPYTIPIFSTFTSATMLIISAFLAAFALLSLAERKGEILRYSWFWILSGIFLYSFGTFFIDVMVSSVLMETLWPIRNVLNITQYIFFCVGLTRPVSFFFRPNS